MVSFIGLFCKRLRIACRCLYVVQSIESRADCWESLFFLISCCIVKWLASWRLGNSFLNSSCMVNWRASWLLRISCFFESSCMVNWVMSWRVRICSLYPCCIVNWVASWCLRISPMLCSNMSSELTCIVIWVVIWVVYTLTRRFLKSQLYGHCM